MKKLVDFLSEYGSCLPGEDRSFGGDSFYIDMIPASSHYHNLRLMMSISSWRKLRLYVLNRADNKCEFCGSSSSLEGHERWSFDEINKIQKPIRLMCLCKNCHLGVHIGVASYLGYDEDIKDHVLNITGWTEDEFINHKKQANENHKNLSNIKWKIEPGFIADIGIEMYGENRIHENVAKMKNNARINDSKYAAGTHILRTQIQQGWKAFCTASIEGDMHIDSIYLDLDDQQYLYSAKDLTLIKNIDFPTMLLMEFCAAYNNEVIITSQSQFIEELKIPQPKRLLIINTVILDADLINDISIVNAFKDRILISFLSRASTKQYLAI